jgi:glycerol-3-phosphate dehydrogenase (NAD(P)+)
MNATPRSIAVVGLGAWGSALALHCARLGHKVVGWHREQSFVREVGASGSLPCANQLFPLPSSLTLSANLADADGADLTIVALPAAAWGEVLPKLPQPKILISATKGLERDTVQTPLAFAKQSLQLADERLCVISGPSFASDLAAARPLSIVAASRSEQTAVLVAEALSGDSLRVYASRDPLGVELGGILKNVIAIACGASDSIGFGPSARAALISRGLAEMSRLAAALGADIQTLTGLSGLGDLVMTATEDQSRNRQVGLRLGRGEKIADIIKALGSTAEGVTTAPLVQTLAATSSVVVPITDMVVELLKGEVPPLELAKRLMTRPIKSEF